LAKTTSQSFVQIGAYDTTYMKDSSNLIWLTDLVATGHWTHYVEAVRFGSGTFETGLPSEFTFSEKIKGIFDTGTSLVYIP
jgi:hypothetical protein